MSTDSRMVRSVRVLVLIASATALVIGTPTIGAADAPVESYRSRGVSAWGLWGDCSRSGCWFMELSVFEGHQKSTDGVLKGARVCLSIATYGGSTPRETDESGCRTARFRTLTASKDISSATLAPTTIRLQPCSWDPEVERWVCDPDKRRRVAVSARWIATSEPFEQSSRRRFRVGNCTESQAHRGMFRWADATAELDGEDVGRTDEAELRKGWLKIRSPCRE